jgi:hypothetical protein
MGRRSLFHKMGSHKKKMTRFQLICGFASVHVEMRDRDRRPAIKLGDNRKGDSFS